LVQVAIHYQGNPYMNHKLWNIVSTERYSICRCCWDGATYKWKIHNLKIKINALFKFWLSTDDQGM